MEPGSTPAEAESELGAIVAIGPAADPPESKYDRLIARAKEVAAAKTLVVVNRRRGVTRNSRLDTLRYNDLRRRPASNQHAG